MPSPISLSKILQAQNNIKPIVHKTPLYYSKSLSEMFDKNIYLKLECFQPINVFKIRGAYNKIIHLSDKEKQMLDHLGITNTTSIGSSLKVTQISSGMADVYLTTTNKMQQWDTCASNCLVSEAGGKMTDIFGNELVYNTENVNHQNGLLATNGFVHDIATAKISEL